MGGMPSAQVTLCQISLLQLCSQFSDRCLAIALRQSRRGTSSQVRACLNAALVWTCGVNLDNVSLWQTTRRTDKR